MIASPPQDQPQEPGAAFDLRSYLRVLAEQKSFIIVFCLAAVASALTLTYVFPEKYEASTSLFYRPFEKSLIRQKENEAFGGPVPPVPFKTINYTLYNIVKSEVIITPVVDILRLDQKETVEYQSWVKKFYHETKNYFKNTAANLLMILKYGRVIDEDDKVRAIEELRKNIDIGASKDSYVYVLKVKDSHPQRAALIVDTAGQYLVNWLREQDQNPAERRKVQLAEQLATKQKEIENLRAQREALLSQSRVASLTEETNSGVKSYYALEVERDQLKAQIEGKRKKIGDLEQKLNQRPRRYLDPGDVRRMESEKLFEEVELRGLTARQASLQAAGAALHGKLQTLLPIQKKVEDLDLKIEMNTREFAHLKDFYVEALTTASTAQSEVKILYPAVASSRPVQPIKIYHVAFTAFLGLGFAIGLAYVFDFFGIRLFTSAQRQPEPPDLLQPAAEKPPLHG